MSESSIGRHRKRGLNGRIKTQVQTMDDQDRFSKLPEPLIIEILSLLELKDAVKTGVLAKSWKNHWTQIRNIILQRHIENDDMEIREIKDKQWVSSVHRTIKQCAATDINRFCLIGYCDFSSVIRKWIAFALDRNVKILKLTNSCKVPYRMFQSSSITRLELCDVRGFGFSSPVNLSSLKSLRLENPTLSDEWLEKILVGCPVLEDLVIDNVLELHHINIISPSVKRFKLQWFENEDDIDFLNIKAPWLQELELSALFVTTQCQLVNVSSLTKATITIHTKNPAVGMCDTEEEDMEYNNEVTQYNYMWIPMVNQLLDSLSYVGELTIGSQPLQVLTLSKVLGKPSPLFKCKHLSIETSLWKFDLPGIVRLLENAPHLETLFIKVLDDWQDSFCLFQTEKLFQDEDPHLSMPDGKFLHLKNIMIDYWRYPCRDDTESSYGEYFDFELVEYILRSAVVLEKLVLCSSSGGCRYKCPVPRCAFQYIPRLSSKLIATFLGGNDAAAEWELKRCKNKFVFTFSNYASLHPTADSSSSSFSP